MATNSIATALIDVKVDNKGIQDGFNQTKQNLNKVAAQIGQSFRQNFEQITTKAIETSRKITETLKIGFVPLLAAGALAVKKFLESASGTQQNKVFKKMKADLDEAVARIGKMIIESNIFGKTIEGWTHSLTKFLNKLKAKDVQRFVKVFENLAKTLAALTASTVLIELVKAIGELSFTLKAAGIATVVSKLSGIGKPAFSGVQNAFNNPISSMRDRISSYKSRRATYMQTRAVYNEVGPILKPTKVSLGGASMLSKFKDIAKFFSGLVVIIGTIALVSVAIKNIAKGFASPEEWKTLLANIKKGEGVAGDVFRKLKSLFKMMLSGFTVIGALLRDLSAIITGDFKAAKSRLMQLVDEYENGAGIKTLSKAKTTPNSETTDALLKQFDSILGSHYDYVKKMEKMKKIIEKELKSTTDLKEAERLKMRLQGIKEALTDMNVLFSKDIESFKDRMNRTKEDLKKNNKFEEVAEAFEDTETYTDKMTNALLGIADNISGAVDKTADKLNEANRILKIQKQFEKERDTLLLASGEAEADMLEKIMQARESLGKGLGYSGGTVGFSQGASFAGQVGMDWQTRLIDFNKEIRDINLEGGKQRNNIINELKDLIRINSETKDLIKEGFGTDSASSLAFGT